MSDTLLLLVILISLAVGYLVADWQGAKRVPRRVRDLFSKLQHKTLNADDSRYYRVLTTLLNEQPDDALDEFISKMGVSAETLEMHLALGAHLRRRGEFDRAVRVHQNLLTRPGLPSESMHQVQLELACDYWRSGLLDRAEALLVELTQVKGIAKSTRRQAAAYLVDIYRDLGDWLAAIDVADQLTVTKFSSEPDEWRRLQAQFCCEIVESALKRGDKDFVVQKLRQALAYDPECIRAYMLRAEFSLANDDPASTLVALEHVMKRDLSFISELIPLLKECLPKDQIVAKFSSIQEHYPSIALVAELLAAYAKRHDDEQCSRLINTEIKRIPVLESDWDLLCFAAHAEDDSEKRVDAINKFLKAKQHYACLNCGTDHKRMIWHCPACQSWSTVRCLPT